MNKINRRAKEKEWEHAVKTIKEILTDYGSALMSRQLSEILKQRHSIRISPGTVGQMLRNADGIMRVSGAYGQRAWDVITVKKEKLEPIPLPIPEAPLKEKNEANAPTFGVVEGCELLTIISDFTKACQDATDVASGSKEPVYVVKFIKKYKSARVIIEDM